MKLTRVYLLVFILVTAVLYNCKKEYSYEGGPLSSGFILKDSNGNCSLVTIAGNFVAGKNLNDSNYLKALVHFTHPGRYNIQSELINGYSFSSSGSISDTGIVVLQLKATGKPVSPGMNTFNIVYNTSVCRV
ncbi:MAG: hypothetical protein JSU05_12545, partial [Bacteroidetes bacterium]|nr:hypothetical protein [Bacteroidota bacterium]